jgi:sterol desaturase/sphingolipid hydroxylase (fatty acid hydroxylase superfamily)
MPNDQGKSFALFSRYASGRSHDLGKMGLRELIGAYFTYPTVLLYFALMAGCAYGAWRTDVAHVPVRAAIAAVAAILVYPLVWYALHRWILHGRLLYKFPLTASLWKRIHFDHHQDPHRLDVLFGSPLNTVPTIFGVTGLVGYLIGGWACAWSGIFAGLAMTLVYEFCHCIQHLNYQPKNPWLVRIKKLHMAHHFHNETGNFGIISFWPDRLLGTLYEDAGARTRSATVFNLGYDAAEAERYPWVAQKSRLRNSPPD